MAYLGRNWPWDDSDITSLRLAQQGGRPMFEGHKSRSIDAILEY